MTNNADLYDTGRCSSFSSGLLVAYEILMQRCPALKGREVVIGLKESYVMGKLLDSRILVTTLGTLELKQISELQSCLLKNTKQLKIYTVQMFDF